MFSTEVEKFDKTTRHELAVPDSAWIRETTGREVEMRIGENLEPLATAAHEGAGQWCVRLPEQIVFTGDPLHARRLLWQAAADTPTRPTTTAPAPPRTGWDHYRART